MSTTKAVIYSGSFPYEQYRIKNAGVYIRVSTNRKSQLQSVDNQIAALVEYVDRQRFLHMSGIYVDIGSGRSAESRKELRRLLDDCKKKSIEVIVTKSISRFGRNTLEMLNICRRLKEMGVDVYFHREKMHSLGTNGELALSLASAVAESESYDKSMNIRWGLEKSLQNPDSKLYSRVCYGYVKGNDGELIIREDQAEVVRTIFRKYLDGDSVQRIKSSLEQQGIPAPSGGPSWPKRTIEKILCNEKYSGSVCFYKTYNAEYPSVGQIANRGQHGKIQVDNHHPAVIQRELFDAVQALMENRKRKKEPVDDR